MASKVFINPFNSTRYVSETSCISAIERDFQDQLNTFGITAKQAIFNYRNRLSIDTKFGKSAISGKPTQWNEQAGRYQRFANDGEIAQYRQMFLERMRSSYGRDHLLDDPEQQRKMLANRSISGVYDFKDGSKKVYTGKEELALLQFFNEALNWPGYDVQCPAPQNFPYTDEDGKPHVYIPDCYIESLNLIVEVKGEFHNGWRSRDIAIEHAKDKILHTSGYNYVKVESQNYMELMDAIAKAKELENHL
jgi:hypothetical protein